MCIWPADIKIYLYKWSFGEILGCLDGEIHKKNLSRPSPPVQIKKTEIFFIDDLVIM